MANVIIDSMDNEYTEQAASAANIKTTVLQPITENTNATILLEGTAAALQAFLNDQGYIASLHPINA